MSGQRLMSSNVGTGRATTVNQLAGMLHARIAPDSAPERAPVHPGNLRYSVADLGKARRMLGYEPKGKLERELDGVIDWCSEHN